MTPDLATDLVRQALVVTILISGPVLIVGLIVGIVVSIIQALTQIQEQTLSLIPKLLAMAAIAVVLMPWICQRLMDYTAQMFGSIAN
jgi:flagellar biosynthesis protein FliQ